MQLEAKIIATEPAVEEKIRNIYQAFYNRNG